MPLMAGSVQRACPTLSVPTYHGGSQLNHAVRSTRNITLASAILAVLLVLAGIFVSAAPSAQASHYRADQITWHLEDGSVEFHLNVSVRASYYGPLAVGDTFSAGSLSYGDGGGDAPEFTVTSVDAANDVITGEAHVVHAYASTGPYNVTFSDCCRLSLPSHINNPDGSILLVTTVDLTKATESPESLISPIVDCPTDAACNFAIPVVPHTPGSTVSFRFATSAESGLTYQPGNPQAPNDATIDPVTGVYSWDTTGATLDPGDPDSTFYSTQVIIEESVNGAVVASVPVDFFIRIGTGVVNVAPDFICPTPEDGEVFTIEEGVPYTFSVAASDPDAADVVTPAVLGVPATATFTPTPGNPGTGVFEWTPDDVGQTILVLQAQDQNGLQAVQRSVTLDVLAAGSTIPPAPVPTACPTPPPTPTPTPTPTPIDPTTPATTTPGPALAATGLGVQPIGWAVIALIGGAVIVAVSQIVVVRRRKQH